MLFCGIVSHFLFFVFFFRFATCRTARIRAVSENLGWLPDPLASSSGSKSGYHSSEDLREAPPLEGREVARLTDAETARTLVEVIHLLLLMNLMLQLKYKRVFSRFTIIVCILAIKKRISLFFDTLKLYY